MEIWEFILIQTVLFFIGKIVVEDLMDKDPVNYPERKRYDKN